MMKKYMWMCMLIAGTLFASCNDDDSPVTGEVASTVQSWVSQNLPGSQNIRMEQEKREYIEELDVTMSCIEVDVVHEGIPKEVLFTSEGEWLLTKYDVSASSLPEAIRTVIATDFSTYWIDEAEAIETPSETFYEIELETNSGTDLKIWLNTDGTVRRQVND